MTEEDSEKNLSFIKAHVARLKDAGFDHVQIFAAHYDQETGTHHWSYGDGDWLGRIGHIMLWIERERAAEWSKEINK